MCVWPSGSNQCQHSSDRSLHVSSLSTGEAAQVVLMGDRLHQVIDAMDLGRATLDKIRANLTWALAYNVVGIPLAAGQCSDV